MTMEFKSEEIKVLYESSSQRGDRSTKIRIVKWIVGSGSDQKEYLNLEKREFFKFPGSDEWKIGKAKGFTLADWNLLTSSMEPILQIRGLLRPSQQIDKPQEMQNREMTESELIHSMISTKTSDEDF